MKKTPEEKWKTLIQTCKKNVQIIMGLSNSIRYAGTINEYGRTLTGIVRPGVKPYWKSEHIKNEFFLIATLMTLHKVHAMSAGNLEYVIIRHKKISIISFAQKNITYYISIDNRERDIEKIISKIKKII